jgi:UDP-glucose 4-epimerase
MRKLEKGQIGIKFYNLGTGSGVSVLKLIQTFEKVNNVKVPFVVQPRREGDISTMFADPKLAETELGWKALHTIEEMCEDFWRWQTQNPDGYKTKTQTNGHLT